MENTTRKARCPRLTEIFEEHMAHVDGVERRIHDSFDDLTYIFEGGEAPTERDDALNGRR